MLCKLTALIETQKVNPDKVKLTSLLKNTWHLFNIKEDKKTEKDAQLQNRRIRTALLH